MKIDKLPILDIGQQGEKNVTVLEFDVSVWDLPDAVWSISYTRPDETAVYPATGVTYADGVLTWVASEAVTAKSGMGTVVIHREADGTEKRSAMTFMRIHPGHDAAGPPPGPMQDWINEAQGLIGNVGAALQTLESITFEINDDGELEVNYG